MATCSVEMVNDNSSTLCSPFIQAMKKSVIMIICMTYNIKHGNEIKSSHVHSSVKMESGGGDGEWGGKWGSDAME